MVDYGLEVDFGAVDGKEDAVLTITVKGCDCMVQDAMMEISQLLKALQAQMRDRRQRIAPEAKPCGCGKDG